MGRVDVGLSVYGNTALSPAKSTGDSTQASIENSSIGGTESHGSVKQVHPP